MLPMLDLLIHRVELSVELLCSLVVIAAHRLRQADDPLMVVLVCPPFEVPEH